MLMGMLYRTFIWLKKLMDEGLEEATKRLCGGCISIILLHDPAIQVNL